jgi:hypothetical protein
VQVKPGSSDTAYIRLVERLWHRQSRFTTEFALAANNAADIAHPLAKEGGTHVGTKNGGPPETRTPDPLIKSPAGMFTSCDHYHHVPGITSARPLVSSRLSALAGHSTRTKSGQEKAPDSSGAFTVSASSELLAAPIISGRGQCLTAQSKHSGSLYGRGCDCRLSRRTGFGGAQNCFQTHHLQLILN